MSRALFIAYIDGNSLRTRRVNLNAQIQSEIAALFDSQLSNFLNGINNFIDFSGGWKPEPEEVFQIDTPEEISVILETVNANLTSIPALDLSNLTAINIKILFVPAEASNDGTYTKVLIQTFDSRQSLEKKFSLIQDSNTFKKITAPAFTLGNSLACIIQNGKLLFKSQHKLRGFINMKDIYKAATDEEVRDFFSSDVELDGGLDQFVNNADQTTRKLISAIKGAKALDTHSSEHISNTAKKVGVNITLRNGKIVLPNNPSDLKNILRFLDDNLYEAALSGQKYITNSKKKASV